MANDPINENEPTKNSKRPAATSTRQARENDLKQNRIPKLGEKMDIPVPKRPGITIGPEGPYTDSLIGDDSDAK